MIKKSLHLCTCMGTASTKKVATPRKAFLVLGNSDDSCRRPSVMYGFQALLTSRRNHILGRGNTQIADIWTCILHSTIHSTAEVDTQSHLNVDVTDRMGKAGKRAGRQRTWSDRQGQRVSVLQGPSVNNAPTVSTDSTPIRSRLSRGYFSYTNLWLYYRSRQITIFTLHYGFKSQHFNTDELYSELLTSISLLLAGTSREVWFIYRRIRGKTYSIWPGPKFKPTIAAYSQNGLDEISYFSSHHMTIHGTLRAYDRDLQTNIMCFGPANVVGQTLRPCNEWKTSGYFRIHWNV